MTIFNLGSINIDRAYSLDHIVAPGETASALALRESPGGKGFNQSIALARAGARVRHIGAIGADGAHLVAMLREAGFGAEEYDNGVHVTVHEDGRPMTYNLSTDSKRPARLDGAAIDEQREIDIEQTIPWQGENLGGGYSRMTLPTERGSINIDPARLTSNRKAPVKVRNCNEKYHYTIQNAGTMVGKPISISRTVNGLGSIKISIKQLGNGAIDVIRELNIDVPDGIVTPKQYKAFRKMMQDWNQYKTVTIRSEKGQPVNPNYKF